MTVHLYNTRSQKVELLQPLLEGKVSMYVCGPTVQSSPHLGHLRSAVNYDLLRRWLTHHGLKVTHVRNITDIDDKILAHQTEDEPWQAVARRVEKEFISSYDALNVLPPTYEPHVTAHITQIGDLIQELLSAGYAYPAKDGSGDIYFSVREWNQYGSISRQLPDMDAAPEERGAKLHPQDFALWKGQKAGEPTTAAWPSPMFPQSHPPGRPGWHIECSAMAHHYLGDAFDIHGGGIDLRFPHHENELAQSAGAGKASASIWTHNNLITVNGEKMSKSLGNSIFAQEALSNVRPVVLRYFLLASHYRSIINVRTAADGSLDAGSLQEAEAAFSRLETALRRAAAMEVEAAEPQPVPAAFAAAMDDDLNTPEAVAVMHMTAHALNTAISEKNLDGVRLHAGELSAMLEVFGLHPTDQAWIETRRSDGMEQALTSLVEQLIQDRAAARAGRDFNRSDALRDLLVSAGISLEDTPEGTVWQLEGS